MTDGAAGWRYLELTYDPRDRTRVRLDGIPLTDGAAVGEVVRRLGVDGWEMVGSAADDDSQQVLWFRQQLGDTLVAALPVPDAPTLEPGAPVPAGPVSAEVGSAEAGVRVTLVGMGRRRSDPHQRRLLIDAVASLTGESGWRATRIVDKAPRVVVAGVTLEEAERIRRVLEALGATVEIG